MPQTAAERATKEFDKAQADVERQVAKLSKINERLGALIKDAIAQKSVLREAVLLRNHVAIHPAMPEHVEPLDVPNEYEIQLDVDPTTVSDDGKEPVVSQVEGEPVSGVLLQKDVDALPPRSHCADMEPRKAEPEVVQAESGKIAEKILAANGGEKSPAGNPQADPFASFQ